MIFFRPGSASSAGNVLGSREPHRAAGLLWRGQARRWNHVLRLPETGRHVFMYVCMYVRVCLNVCCLNSSQKSLNRKSVHGLLGLWFRYCYWVLVFTLLITINTSRAGGKLHQSHLEQLGRRKLKPPSLLKKFGIGTLPRTEIRCPQNRTMILLENTLNSTKFRNTK